jgi:hypothetical protein
MEVWLQPQAIDRATTISGVQGCAPPGVSLDASARRGRTIGEETEQIVKVSLENSECALWYAQIYFSMFRYCFTQAQWY